MTHLQSIFGPLSQANQPQQQQQQQSQNLCGQPLQQTKPTGLFNQQSNLYQQQQQPCNNNAYQPTYHNNPFAQPTMQQPPTYNSSSTSGCCLPPNLMDQLRSLTNNATPIFILPAGLTSSSSSGGGSTSPCVTPCFSPTCIPFPIPMPIYQNLGLNSSSSECDCKCGRSKSQSDSSATSSSDNWQNEIKGLDWTPEHVCKEGHEGTVCSKKNCPASIQLQAMISQLLGIQGVVPSAITRILLKRVPGSNVPDSVDEIMEKSARCIRQLPKNGLLRESCNSREVTKLLGLYLTSSSTIPRIIPVLTTVQLKCNILKALVESLVSSMLMQEQQSGGVESDEQPMDRLLLELKSEDELRRMLAGYRERECEERVNASFAACASQSRIAEARLAGWQRKIRRVEDEIQRRRCELPVMREDGSEESTSQNLLSMLRDCRKNLDSPDPFAEVEAARSPKRLLLKPHVGSPETTYERPGDETAATCKSVAFDEDVKKDDDDDNCGCRPDVKPACEEAFARYVDAKNECQDGN